VRVCLTNPPWEVDGARGIRAGCRVPNTIGSGQHTFIPFPYTLAYATSKLASEGVEVRIVDAIGEELDADAFRQRVAEFEPDLVVVEMATQSHDVDLAFAAQMREQTGARIVVCGSHPTALPEEILEHACVDFVMLGEYEQTLSDLVRALTNAGTADGVSGLAWRKMDGTPCIGSRREPIPDLDDLPWPHRETLPLHNYRVGGFPGPVLYMYASRGCPYLCNFCVWPQWFGSGVYRVRSPRAVVDEIEDAQRRWGPFRSIYFDDDTFNIGKPRMLEMADEFERRGIDIPWGCNARPDRFDEEMMRRLAEVGLFTIRIGVESGDPEVLKRIHKNLDLDSVGRCIALAQRYGVKCHVTFTVGLSGESWDSVKRSVAFARSIRPDSVAFTVTTPFPGTAYWDEVVRKGHLTTRDWNRFNVVSNSVVRTETMTPEEIVEAEKYLMRKVYYSPRYVWRRLRYASSGAEFGALVRKGFKFLAGRY